jgi:hypothetical protein
LSNRERAGNKRDGEQFCFHVFASLLLLTGFPAQYNAHRLK